MCVNIYIYVYIYMYIYILHTTYNYPHFFNKTMAAMGHL